MSLLVNKVVYAGETLIDLTKDTVTAANLAAGIYAHNKAGERIRGIASIGDIQSVSVTTLPIPSSDITGNVYKYDGEYYSCFIHGTPQIYTGMSISSTEQLITFPSGTELAENFSGLTDVELFKIGYSDSDYVTCNYTMYGSYDVYITIDGTSIYLNENSETIINLSEYYGDSIISVSLLGEQILNSATGERFMANITTGYAPEQEPVIDTSTADSIIDGTITSISNDRVTTINDYAFYGCTALTTVNFPAVTNLGTYAFYGCTALTTADFSAVESLQRAAFYNCSALTSLILRNNAVVTLVTTNAFNNSAIKTGTGYVYVPDNLVDSYKAAANWSTYAAQIKGLSELTE